MIDLFNKKPPAVPPAPVAPDINSVPNKPPLGELPKESRLIYFFIGLLVILIISALAGIILGTSLIIKYQRKTLPLPPPITTATPGAVPVGLKKHATDSAVLKTQNDVQNLQSEINSTDYFETEIAPPVIDSNIQIQ